MAQSPTTSVEVVVAECPAPGFDVGEFMELLRVELRLDGVAEVIRRDPADKAMAEVGQRVAVLKVDGHCEGDLMTFVLEDAVTDKTLRRSIPLAQLEMERRPRATSLSAAELMRASWMELLVDEDRRGPAEEVLRRAAETRVREEMVVAPTIRASAASEPVATPVLLPTVTIPPHGDGGTDTGAKDGPSLAGWRTKSYVSVGPSARVYFGEVIPLAGARLDVTWPITQAIRGRVGAGAVRGQKEHGLGDVEFWVAGTRVSAAYAFGGDGYFFELGPTFTLDIAYARGSPNQAIVESKQGISGLSSLGFTGGFQVRLAENWWAMVDADVGQTLGSVTARSDELTASTLDGAVGGLRMSLALPL